MKKLLILGILSMALSSQAIAGEKREESHRPSIPNIGIEGDFEESMQWLIHGTHFVGLPHHHKWSDGWSEWKRKLPSCSSVSSVPLPATTWTMLGGLSLMLAASKTRSTAK